MQGDQQQFFSGQSYPQQPGYNVGFAPQPAVAPGFHPSAFAPSPEAAGYAPYDAESTTAKGFDFSDQSIRRGFIKKVYSILTVQLAITFTFVTVVMLHKPTRRVVQESVPLFWIAFIVMFVALIGISCCGEMRRKAPMNFILLGLFTLAESFLVAVVSAQYDADVVMIALGITAVICLGLTLFAFQTKYDFTMMGGFLFCVVLVFFMFGLIAIFFEGTVITLIYSALGALIFSMYLVYDTQIMLGGEHKYSISPEEYVFAALSLYLDVINIFLHILRIVAVSRR
ncbi:protein lifeguard 1-like [Anopheles ziemanni]|uniref:protein lifeguard 1-like n=1 Tax=Anopheles coustani TaxID=139045 RepID=UPI0026584992|nr:protein lifeguard 1-like [Anopheles coustani]XP_058166307.1 protein lifeguard 1-like [Anopheles ziemanni]